MNLRAVVFLVILLLVTCCLYLRPPPPQGLAGAGGPPAAAKEGAARPSLWVEHAYEHSFGKAGYARVWTLSGRGVKELAAYLMVYSEGKGERLSEVRCTWAAPSPPLAAQIAFWNQDGQPFGAKGKLLPSLSLTFRSGAPSKKKEKHTGKLLAAPRGGSSSMNYDYTGVAVSPRTVLYNKHLHMKPNPPLKEGEIRGGVVGGGTSEEAMAKASRRGRVVLAVVVEWKK